MLHLKQMPEKIVVFDYGFLDTLDALGVEGVVGVPKDSTLPDNFLKILKMMNIQMLEL